MKKQLINFYLEYFNDFITISRMAEYYNISKTECQTLVELGRKYHNEQFD